MKLFNDIVSDYFTRALIFPKDIFLEVYYKYVNEDGTCDIYMVAEELDADYEDVRLRARDLNLWAPQIGQ